MISLKSCRHKWQLREASLAQVDLVPKATLSFLHEGSEHFPGRELSGLEYTASAVNSLGQGLSLY